MKKTDLNLKDTLKLIDESEEFASELATSIEESVMIHKERTAIIESATSLSDEEMGNLKEILQKRFKIELVFDFRVNPLLLGGFRVSVGDWKVDASLLASLERMKQQAIDII